MRYLMAHKDSFEQIFLPYMICCMKIICELMIELVEVLTTFVLNDELWIIMDYSAFTCISYIATQYYILMEDSMKTKLVTQNKYSLKIENEIDFEETRLATLRSYKYSLREKVYYFVLLVIEFLYETVYFYFFPYFAIFYAIYSF